MITANVSDYKRLSEHAFSSSLQRQSDKQVALFGNLVIAYDGENVFLCLLRGNRVSSGTLKGVG